jgi:hypothetical protein
LTNSFDDAVNLIQHLRKEGFSFYVDGDNIRVHPAGILAPADRELIRANKSAILSWLKWYAEDRGCTDAARHWQSEGRQ